jgi:hypothetical protein
VTQAGCQALMNQFGVGELIALTFLSELGDASRNDQLTDGSPVRRTGHRRASL